jgi:hypothetical protein
MSKHSSKKSKKRDEEDTDDGAIMEEYGESARHDKKKHNTGGKSRKPSKKRDESEDESESEGDSENEDSEDEATISENFRKAVINYIKYDNKSRQLRELQSQINAKKKELSEMIIGKMDDGNMKTIAITGGKLHRNKAETQAPLKQEMILKTLKNEVGKRKAKDLMAKIQEQRPMTTRINLKRIKDREDKKASSKKRSHSR